MTRNSGGFTVWFTGLPSAGKSTLAQALRPELERFGLAVEILDGDEVRQRLTKGLGFSREDRDENIHRIAYAALLVTRTGGVAVTAAISPYRATRQQAREEIKKFIEVFVDCPLETCKKRDVKGLYAKALKGELSNFTGVSDPYEPPVAPDVRLQTDRESVAECVRKIIRKAVELGYLQSSVLSAPHGGRLINRIVPEGKSRRGMLEESSSPARLELNEEQLCHLENITMGIYSPLEGFMGSEDLQSVLSCGRLRNGLAWTLPIVLDIPQAEAGCYEQGRKIVLTFQDQVVGVLDLMEKYRQDREQMARTVFGTLDDKHPGVSAYLNMGEVFLAGPVELLQDAREAHAGRRLSPRETRSFFADMGWRKVVGFQTRNVPHLGHEYVQKMALSMVDGLFINPIIGRKKSGDFEDRTIIKAYETLLRSYYPKDRAFLSVFCAPMQYAGPREAIFHAIVRKNFGCTHFIVGRDHAGVGNYYTPYAAHEIFKEYPDLGIEPVFFKSFFHCKACGAVASEKICPHSEENHLPFSATLIREALKQSGRAPSYLLRPEVLQVLEADRVETASAD